MNRSDPKSDFVWVASGLLPKNENGSLLSGGHQHQLRFGQNLDETRCLESSEDVVVNIELPMFFRPGGKKLPANALINDD